MVIAVCVIDAGEGGAGMIIADVSEPEELKKIADEVKDLGFDYWIIGKERQYYIERKELCDLVASLRGKSGHGKVKQRLFEQLERIKILADEANSKGVDACAILIVEGNIFMRYRARFARLTPAQWMGIQARIAEMGVGLIRTWNIDETKMVLQILNRRAKESVKEIPDLTFSKSLRDIKTEAVHVLMAISGIGQKKAVELIKWFGSVKNVLNASERELAMVVGEKLARHIKEVVEYRFSKGLEEV